MRTYEPEAAPARTLASVFDDAVAILRQDAGEYSFIGLLGAAPACLLVLILHMIGNAVAAALIPPMVIVAAVLTLTTATEALRRVGESLEPDAGRAFAAVGLHAHEFLRPWVQLAVILGGAAFGMAILGNHVGSLTRLPINSLIVVFAAVLALPRSFVPVALLTQRATYAQADAGSRALVAQAPARVVYAWAIALAPALLFGLIALVAGFGTVSSAVAAFAFVGMMPVGAVIMSLLFYDALGESLQ